MPKGEPEDQRLWSSQDLWGQRGGRAGHLGERRSAVVMARSLERGVIVTEVFRPEGVGTRSRLAPRRDEESGKKSLRRCPHRSKEEKLELLAFGTNGRAD